MPTDFIVLEMNEDSWILIILRRSFLATAGAIIVEKNHKLSLSVGEDKVEFNLSKSANQPSAENSYCKIDCLP